MIRRAASRTLRPLRRRRRKLEAARGIRSDVPLPFDMFEATGTADELKTARKLENLYHKGQKKAWNGKEVLQALVEKHGGVQVDPRQRKALQTVFAVILWGELAAWKISADLALQIEPMEAKMAATAQAHDEARHFYVMHDYLELLGDVPHSLGPRATRVLRGTLEADTLVKKLIGMQMMIEPMALTLFQIVRESRLEPVLSDLLAFYERDEARHVALGVLHLPRLLKGMGPIEAMDLWTWEFREFWNEFSLMHELQEDLEVLGIDPREVIRIGREKQIRANLMLMEELGYDIKMYTVFVRFFDMKSEWDFPTKCDRSQLLQRARNAVRAGMAERGEVPQALTNAAPSF